MAQRRGRGNIWRLCLLPPSWSLQKLKTIWNNQNFFTHPQSIKMLLRLTWNKHNSVVVAHGLGVWRRSEKKHFFSCTSCTLKSSEKNEVCKHMEKNHYLSLFTATFNSLVLFVTPWMVWGQGVISWHFDCMALSHYKMDEILEIIQTEDFQRIILFGTWYRLYWYI